MLGMQGLKARKLMKMEKPRPLKIACHTDQSMESVLAEMDLVAQHLNSGTFDRSLYPSITALCESLKMFGPQLENVYKDQLDKCYISLRNGCRDDRLSLAARYRLLEVIELRAMHWQPNENLINYYKQKLAQIEAEEGTLDDHGEIPVFTPTSVMTPTGSHQQPLFPNMTINTTTMTNSNQTVTSTVTQQQQQHTQTPILLGPGEVIKNSGKFAKPTRIPGKNYCKDEVVIRNADSGKVMGIKGRRVHMIEELSETIISFQRVAPGARERLVQITGPAEENINQAKQLIEETIRRNASPVRGEERLSSYASLGGSSSSISSHTSDETLQVLRRQLSLDETMLRSKRNTLVHSYSMGDDPIGEYRYTVTHGSEAIKITGSNLHLVRTAKLVLDEYFNGERNLNNISILLGTENGSEQSYGGSTGPSSISPTCSPISLQTEVDVALAAAEGNMSATSPSASDAQRGLVSVVRQPLYPSASKEAFETAEVGSRPVDVKARARRAQFAKTSDERTSISLNGDEDAGPSTPCSACPEASVPSLVPATTSPPPPQSPTTASPPPSPAAQTSAAGRMTYSRAFLLQCASSPLSQLTPLNWGRVVQDNPAVLKKGAQVLEGVVATLSKNGEAAISGVPTYLQLKDLIDGASFLARELRWTFHRTMSVTEEDDNGNA